MTDDPIVCRTLTSADELAPLAGAWDRMVLEAARPSPFLLHAWLMEWLRHYGDDVAPRVHVAWRDGALVGALPLMIRRGRGPRVVQFLGDHGYGVQLADVLLADRDDAAAATALLRHAARGRHLCADLRTVPATGVLGSLARRAAIVEHGTPPSFRLIERLEAPVLDIRGGWQPVYMAKISSRKRADWRRRRRRLCESGRVDVTVARTRADLAAAIDDAFRLHRLRWVDRFDGSDFGSARGERFHRAAIAALAEAGVPRIVTLRVDGRAIAFHYAFVLRDRWLLHRLAFDPAFAVYSPGLLVTLDALDAAAQDGIAHVEFLGGGDGYKAELAADPAPLHEALGLASWPLGHAYVQSRVATIRLRRRLKQSPTLHRLYAERLSPARRALARWSGVRDVEPGRADSVAGA